MKHLYILLLAIPLIFSSCEKDDNSTVGGAAIDIDTNYFSDNPSESLVGTWEITNAFTQQDWFYIDPVSGAEVEHPYLESSESVWDGSNTVIYTFNDDNTWDRLIIYDYYYYDYYYGYTYEGTDTIIDSDTYEHIGNELILNPWCSDYDYAYTITKLTNSSLEFNATHDREYDMYDYYGYYNDTIVIRRLYEDIEMSKVSSRILTNYNVKDKTESVKLEQGPFGTTPVLRKRREK